MNPFTCIANFHHQMSEPEFSHHGLTQGTPNQLSMPYETQEKTEFPNALLVSKFSAPFPATSI